MVYAGDSWRLSENFNANQKNNILVDMTMLEYFTTMTGVKSILPIATKTTGSMEF